MPKGPWCRQHQMHPNECFELHYPEAFREHRQPSEAEMRHDAIQRHIQRQNENIRAANERMSRDVVDARKRFEERKRKGA